MRYGEIEVFNSKVHTRTVQIYILDFSWF